MPYPWIAFLLPFFFIWAFILERVAHFLIHQPCSIPCVTSDREQTSQILTKIFTYKSITQWLLRLMCTLSFLTATFTCLPNTPAYFIFISALWITVHTDLEYMLISRLVSLYLVPVGILASALHLLPITPTESILASFFAGSFLMITNKIFKLLKGHDGLGQGDIELLAFIGAWIGLLGTWCTIVIGSITGTIVGLAYLVGSRRQIRILPFGPFLALGALLFLMHWKHIMPFLLSTEL